MAESVIKNGEGGFANLKEEINLLRSFLIGVAGKDKEGNYRPEFVRRILEASREKEKFVFKSGKSFLSAIGKK